jgi:hypothetical protein
MATNLTEISRRVAPDVMGCPNVLVDEAVLRTIIKFCEETHILEKAFEHDVLSTDIVAADNDSVNVNLATYITDGRPILLTEFRIDGAKWDAQEIKLLNDQDDLDEISISGTKFFTWPDTTHIKFYGIEAEDQRFYIKQIFVPLDTATTMDDDLYYRFRDTIAAGARARLMSMPRKDWTDQITAAKNLSDYNDGVASAKIKKDKGMTRRSTSVKSLRFF